MTARPGHRCGPVAYLSAHEMALGDDHAAVLAAPRPCRAALGDLLATVGAHHVARTRTHLDGADAYLRHEPHPGRRLVVSLDCGDVHVEHPDGGVDREPVTDLHAAFGLDEASYGPVGSVRRVLLETREPAVAATCLQIALRRHHRDCAAMVARGGPVELSPPALVELLLAAVTIAAGRRVAVRGWRRRTDLSEYAARAVLGLRPAA